MKSPRGEYSRGYLPHIDAGSVPVFLTWRLDDSLPYDVWERLAKESADLEEKQAKAYRYRAAEAYLDEGHGQCILAQSVFALAVQQTLLHDHGKRYQLHAWAIMPNHVHVLLTPCEGVSLTTIMRTLKGFSARRIQEMRGVRGRLWQPECFDRTMRDPEHFSKTLAYIEWNPVKAKLCADPKHYVFSSAYPNNAEQISGSLG